MPGKNVLGDDFIFSAKSIENLPKFLNVSKCLCNKDLASLLLVKTSTLMFLSFSSIGRSSILQIIK